MAGSERAHRARQGRRLSQIWSESGYDQIAARFAPIHDELVERLAPRRDERWLDVGTGTGAVALRAASAGAAVTALDISPEMLARAREHAAEEGIELDLDEGDAQSLPYADGSFDVAASCFGVVFASDREAVARELARVTRHRGRLGLTAWKPRPEARAIYARFQDEPPALDHTDWGVDGFAESLLGDAFALHVEERVWYLEGDSAEAVYDFLAESAPPTKAFLARLAPERSAEFRASMIDCFSRFADGRGAVREPRPYILVLGTRR